MNETLFLKTTIKNRVFLVGKLENESNVKYTFEYISDPDGEPIDFERVQYLPLKYKRYTWYGQPDAFDEMIIRPDRPDLPKLLKLLGMDKYDIWEFLKRTKGRSETNSWFLDTDDAGFKINMTNTY